MTNKKPKNQQRQSKVLLFLMGFFREAGNTAKYFYKSLSNSMRRRIAFDYLLMYIVLSIMTLMVFVLGYNVLKVNQLSSEAIDDIYNLAILREIGSFSDEQLTNQIHRMGDNQGIGISLRTTYDQDTIQPYTLQTDNFEASIYEARYMDHVWLFIQQGLVKKHVDLAYERPDAIEAIFHIQLVEPFNVVSSERTILIFTIMISQFVGLTIMSLVGAYRLKHVFTPIYGMTKAAEKISLNNMNAMLDVSRAEYELKDLAATFNEMIERMRRDYVKQKRFVSDVSHELRTPISIVNGYARMLERWGKNDAAILNESIYAIRDESKNMQVLVENLLTLVRSDNQTLKFEKEYFLLDVLGEELIKDMAMIDEGRHSFTKTIEKNIEVCLDYAKVKQAIRIFLDNASKYTPEGGAVHMTITSEEGSVFIEVKDSGIGISREDMPHLFERFYRSDESRTRDTGGHGLGLAIAKVMVVGQKGKIKVRSKVNHGTSFTLILPKCLEEKATDL